MKKNLVIVLVIVLALSIALSACGGNPVVKSIVGANNACGDITSCVYNAPSSANAICTATGGVVDANGMCQSK